MSQIPEIKAEALLDLVLDEAKLKQQLSRILGSTVSESAAAAKIGENLIKPTELKAMREKLSNEFKLLAKDFSGAVEKALDGDVQKALAALRTDTVKVFQNDLEKLTKTGGLPKRNYGGKTYPELQLGDKGKTDGLVAELRNLVRVFGVDGMRRGDYQGDDTNKIKRRIDDVNKVLEELAGLPVPSAKDLKLFQKVLRDGTPGKYQELSGEQRESMLRASKSLDLQLKAFDKLANTVSKFGFGEVASEIKASISAQKQLVTQYNSLINPVRLEAERRKESAAEQAQRDKELRDKQRMADKYAEKQKKAEARGVQKAEELRSKGDVYQTIFGERVRGQVGPGLAASMSDEERLRSGSKSRYQVRTASLDSLRKEAVKDTKTRVAAAKVDQGAADYMVKLQADYFAEQRAALDRWYATAEKASKEEADQQAARAKRIADENRRATEAADKAQNTWQKTLQAMESTNASDYFGIADLQQKRLIAWRKLEAESLKRAAAEEKAGKRKAASQASSFAPATEGYRILDRVGGIGNLSDPMDIRDVSAGLRTARTAAMKAMAQARVFFGEQSDEYAKASADFDQVSRDRALLAERLRALRPQTESDEDKLARRQASYTVASGIIGRAGGISGINNRVELNDVSKGLNAELKRVNEQLAVLARNGKEASDEFAQLASRADQLNSQRLQVEDQRRALSGGGSGPSGPTPVGMFAGSDRLLSTFGKYTVGYGALYSMISAAQMLITELVELDRAFFSIKAVTQATDREMRAITRSIREVALATNFSSREIANSAELLGQAGVKPEDMDRVMMATAQFASATNSSLEVAADLITTVKTVYKDLEKTPGVIGDQLTRAINISKLSAEDLKTILSLTSQTAESYNVSLEQLLGAVTTLRNAGIKPSTVATGLRQAMLEVFNPDTNTTKALAARYAQMGERDMSPDAIKQRFFGFKNSSDPLLAMATELRRIGFADEGQKELQRGFDIRAFNALSAFVSNIKEYERAPTQITFGQAAQEGADIQLQSLTATMENLGSSIVALADQISGDLMRSIQRFAEGMTGAIEGLTELDLELKARGTGGLTDVAQGAFGGGIAGAVLGKGITGKILGGLAGAAAGGATSYLGQTAEDGEFSGADIAELGSILVFVGGAIAGLMKKFRVIGRIGDMIKKVPGADKVLGGAASSPAEAGSLVGSVLGFLTGVGAILTVVEAVFDALPKSELEQLQQKARAAQEKAAAAREKLTNLDATLAQYDVKAADPAKGTFPESLRRYEAAMDEAVAERERLFGQQLSERAQQILDIYADTSKTARDGLLEELRQETGKVDLQDRDVFNYTSMVEQLSENVDAMRESIRRRLEIDLEESAKARADGRYDQLDDQIKARLDAAERAGPELAKILNNTSELSFDEQRQIMENYTGMVYEILDVRPKLEAERRDAQMLDLASQLQAQLASADNSGQIAMLVANIGNSIQAIGLSAADQLRAIEQALGTRGNVIDASIEEKKAQRANLGFGFGSRRVITGEDKATDARLAAEIAELEQQKAAIEQAKVDSRERTRQAEIKEQRDLQQKTRMAADNAYANIEAFSTDKMYQKALSSPEAMREIQLTAKERKFFEDNKAAFSGNSEATRQLVAKVSAQPKKGEINETADVFNSLVEKVTTSAEKATKDMERRAAAEKAAVNAGERKAVISADVALKKAEYRKDYDAIFGGLLDDKYAAEKAVLLKEVEQAENDAKAAKEDGDKNYVDKEEKAAKLRAELELLDLQKTQDVEKYKQQAKTAGEAAQRKADQEKAKQSKIAITQTGIEQRIAKKNFDEAIELGDFEKFKQFSDEFIAIQQKLKDQLAEELEARGYTADQIKAEIDLRDDLNKPLAEQAENLNKLFDQRARLRDLEYADVGQGPNLGGTEQSAYLGRDGFTGREMATAASSDLLRLRQRESAILAEQQAAEATKAPKETLDKQKNELREVQTQIGETRYDLENLVMTSDQALAEVLDGRQWVIGLEQTGRTFETMGDNLRNGLLAAFQEIGDAIARAINEGEDFGDTLQRIANDFATQQLGMMIQTNLNEGLQSLIEGGNGLLESMGLGGISDIFGGSDKKGAEASSPMAKAKEATGGIADVLGMGDSDTTAVMNVSAGVVNVGGASAALDGLKDLPQVLGKDVPQAVTKGMEKESKSFFSGIFDWFSGSTAASQGGQVGGAGGGGMLSGIGNWLGGLFNQGGATSGAASGADIGKAAGQYGPEVAKMGGSIGLSGPGAAAGGSWMGALGGAGMGAGLGGTLGGAIGGEKGSKWGTILGALAGAYFGFGMASGGYIDSRGVVRGSPGAKRGVDSVPVTLGKRGGRLAPGEGVLNTRAMDVLGEDFVHQANSGQLERSVGAARSQSYNATKATKASGAKSVAQAVPAITVPAPEVQLKNVNVFDPSEIRSAFTGRDGEDVLINTLRRRGAIK